MPAEPADRTAIGAARHYGMDWLRIGAFALLILYHVGLVFSPWSYELKSSQTADWVAMPLLALNAWRLSLLFAISGYASASLFRRDGQRTGRFLRGRLARLGIPLLFGMAVLVTPQPWVALVMQHGYGGSFWHFLAHDYYQFQEIDGIATPTWMHLWFVAYLVAYTLVLSALLLLPARTQTWLRGAAEKLLAGPLLLPLPIVYFYFARELPPGWTDTHALVDDFSAHAVYFAAFLFGWLLRGSDAVRAAIARQWKLALVVGLAGAAGVLAAEFTYPGSTPLPDDLRLPFNAARAMQMWGMIVALFGIADRFWNHDARWRPMLAEAVFPFYIIHQTAILLVGYWLRDAGLGMLAEFLVLTLATALACALFYLLGRSIGPLRPLIGLKRRSLIRG